MLPFRLLAVVAAVILLQVSEADRRDTRRTGRGDLSRGRSERTIRSTDDPTPEPTDTGEADHDASHQQQQQQHVEHPSEGAASGLHLDHRQEVLDLIPPTKEEHLLTPGVGEGVGTMHETHEDPSEEVNDEDLIPEVPQKKLLTPVDEASEVAADAHKEPDPEAATPGVGAEEEKEEEQEQDSMDPENDDEGATDLINASKEHLRTPHVPEVAGTPHETHEEPEPEAAGPGAEEGEEKEEQDTLKFEHEEEEEAKKDLINASHQEHLHTPLIREGAGTTHETHEEPEPKAVGSGFDAEDIEEKDEQDTLKFEQAEEEEAKKDLINASHQEHLLTPLLPEGVGTTHETDEDPSEEVNDENLIPHDPEKNLLTPADEADQGSADAHKEPEPEPDAVAEEFDPEEDEEDEEKKDNDTFKFEEDDEAENLIKATSQEHLLTPHVPEGAGTTPETHEESGPHAVVPGSDEGEKGESPPTSEPPEEVMGKELFKGKHGANDKDLSQTSISAEAHDARPEGLLPPVQPGSEFPAADDDGIGEFGKVEPVHNGENVLTGYFNNDGFARDAAEGGDAAQEEHASPDIDEDGDDEEHNGPPIFVIARNQTDPEHDDLGEVKHEETLHYSETPGKDYEGIPSDIGHADPWEQNSPNVFFDQAQMHAEQQLESAHHIQRTAQEAAQHMQDTASYLDEYHRDITTLNKELPKLEMVESTIRHHVFEPLKDAEPLHMRPVKVDTYAGELAPLMEFSKRVQADRERADQGYWPEDTG